MKVSEFRKLIREEVRKVIKEGEEHIVNIGDKVYFTVYETGYEGFPIRGELEAIFPNMQAALNKYKGDAKTTKDIKRSMQAIPPGSKKPSPQDKLYIIRIPQGVYGLYGSFNREAYTQTELKKSLRNADVVNSTGFNTNNSKMGVPISQLEKMKATVGYIANDGPVYDLSEDYDEMTAEDARIVSFEKGSKKVLKYAEDYGADASEIKQMAVKLEKLKTMGTKFVLYAVESDLNLGVL